MTDFHQKVYIGVIGAGHCTNKLKKIAYELGKEIAESGSLTVCGGLDGIMKGVAEGTRAARGSTIGIIPSDNRADANEYVDYVVATGMGEARNLVIIRTADVVIALPGMFGTLSELGFALKMKKPVISLGSWDIHEKIIKAENPKEAVKLALQEIQK